MNTKLLAGIALASAQPYGRIAYAEIPRAAQADRDLHDAYALLCGAWRMDQEQVAEWCSRVGFIPQWVAECVKRGDTFTVDGRRIPREFMMDK